MSGYLNDQAVATVREAMARAGVNQTELARRVGVTPAAISRALSGKQNLTLDTVQSYLDELGARAAVSLESVVFS